MSRRIEIIGFRDHIWHVLIDGLHVGTGREPECRALVDELRRDKTGEKANVVYNASLCPNPGDEDMCRECQRG